jgi:hypothetical protein
LWAGLIGSAEDLLGRPLGHGVGLGAITGLGCMALGLLLVQVTPMAALALLTGVDAVGAWWGIRLVFQPVNKGVEGANDRRLEGREAGDRREAWMGAQVVGPLRETFVVEQQHEEKGPEHTNGVVWRAAAWAGGIECAQQGTSRVEIEA